MKAFFTLLSVIIWMTLPQQRVSAQTGDNCATIIDLTPLSSPQTYSTCGLTGSDIAPAPSCITTFGSMIFRIDVPSGENLRIRAAYVSFLSFGASLRTGGACPGSTQLSCTTSAHNQNFYYANTTGSTQTAYFIIWNSSSFFCGDVTIDWDFSTPEGDDCAEAVDLNILSSPQTYYNCGNAGSDIAGTCIPNGSPSMVFTIDVPAGEQLNIRKPSDLFNSSHSLRVGGACPGTTEITCSAVDTDWSSYENTTAMTQTAYYIVWGDALTDCGEFNLEWHFSTPGGDNCADIVTFTGSSGSFTGSLAGFANNGYLSCAVTADFVAQIDVPDGHRLRVFTPVVFSGQQLELKRGGACPGTTSVAGCYSFLNSTDLQYYDNSTGSTQTVYVLVGGPQNGPFQFDWEIDPLTSIPAGDNCSNAIDLDLLTSPITVDNTDMVGNIPGHCHTYSSKTHTYRDFVANITVPDGYRLQIRVLDNNIPGTTNPDVTLRWGGSCPGANEVSCFVDAPFITNTFDNTTGSPQEAYFVVAPWLSRQFGESELSWELFMIPASPPANDACAGAIDLTNPGSTESIANQDVYDATDDVLTCSPTNPDGRHGVWYKVIGNGCVMTASSSNFPYTNYDTEIALYSGNCGMLTCLDYNDENDVPIHTTNGTMNVGTDTEAGGGSAVQWMSVAGQEYFIFVAEGPFSFRPVGDLQITLSSACPMGDNDFGNLDPNIWPPAHATVPSSGVQVWAGANAPNTETSTNTSDDADGLTTITPSLIIGQPNSVQITLNTNTANTDMYYGLWFDWDNDGTFDDFYSGMTTSPASAPFSVDVFTMVTPNPSLATAGEMYAIRLVVSANPVPNTPDGSFLNGEVEDYGTPVPLPVKLLTFEARTEKCGLFLYWETAMEQNFGYYEIEAAADGRNFHSVYQVKPASSHSSTRQVYQHPIDKALINNYFRLKMVDLDGSFEYSKIIYATHPCESSPSISLYPNPNLSGKLMVEIQHSKATEQAQLVILDAWGRKVHEQKLSLQSGMNLFEVDTQQLFTGSYYLYIIGIERLTSPIKFIR